MQSPSELQAEMIAYLTSPPGPDLPGARRDLLRSSTVQPNKRDAIYRNNFCTRLVDTLRVTFPAVERLVGEEFYRYAAIQFIAAHPPKAPTLLYYGQEFPDFLGSFESAAPIPYLGDVARLEYLYLEAYHAADTPPLKADIATAQNDDARLTLHPSARLMMSPFQVSRIWELNRRETPFDDVTLPPAREYLLIIRPGRQVEVRRVPFGAYAMLFTFHHGGSIAAARDEAEWAEPGFPFDVHLAALAAAGAFVQTDGTETYP